MGFLQSQVKMNFICLKINFSSLLFRDKEFKWLNPKKVFCKTLSVYCVNQLNPV